MTENATRATEDFPILGIDYVEFYVGNANQAASYYTSTLGFRPVAWSGPESGVPDRSSHLLSQGDIRFIFTGATTASSEIAEFTHRHGDGVKNIAFTVPDANHAWKLATGRGAFPVTDPQTVEDDSGTITTASIQAFGDTIHTFVERHGEPSAFLPGFQKSPTRAKTSSEPIVQSIDHIVANVPMGAMTELSEFYARVLGFTQIAHFRDDQISSEQTALMTKVMADDDRRVKFPIIEPAPGKRRSQNQEFLDYYGGPGVQHIALQADDICTAVRTFSANGLEFLRIPASYYDNLSHLGPIEESISDLRELNILSDRDDEGYLLQIFTRRIGDRPTIFYELIQRRGATGFGVRNIRELFLAVEREQEARGNL